MSGPVRPPLTTKLDNNSSENRPVNTIAFANTDFTLTNSGTKTTVGLSGGGGGSIGGTIAAGQVAFGTAADTIGGDASFTFDITGTPKLKLLGTTPRLYLGDSDVSTAENEMLLIMKSAHQSYVYDRENNVESKLNLGANDVPNNITIYKDKIQLNDSQADIDTKIMSSSGVLLLADAGQNNVGIGGTPDSGVQRLHVIGSGESDPLVKFETTHSGSAAAPQLNLFRNSASPVNGDNIGSFKWSFQNDNGNVTDNLCHIFGEVMDVTEGTEDSQLRFYTMKDGTSNEKFRIAFDEVVVNDLSASCDFRVESDAQTHMLYVRSDTNRVGIGTDNPATTLHVVGIATIGETSAVGATNFAALSVNGSTSLATFRASNVSSGDQVGGIRVFSDNFRSRGMMIGAFDVTLGTETEQYLFGTQYAKSGSAGISASPENGGAEYITCYGLGVGGVSSVAINDDKLNMDFKVGGEGAGVHLIWADAGRDAVGILGQPADDVALHVFDNDNQDVLVRLETDENSADKSPALEFFKNSAADISDYIMAIDTYGLDDGSNKSQYSRIATYIEDETAATENGVIIFQVAEAGSLRSNFIVGSTLITMNANSRNVDFRHFADDGVANIYSDAGVSALGIRGAPTTGLADNNPALQVQGSLTSKIPVITDSTTSVTVASNQLNGQMFVLTNGSAITLTLPTSAAIGDNFTFMSTSSNVSVASTGVVTINGVAAPTTLAANTNYKIYKVVAHSTDKWTVDVT